MNSDESLGLLGALARYRALSAGIVLAGIVLGGALGFTQLGQYSASAQISFNDPVNSPVTGSGGGGSTVQEFARFVSGEARLVESDAVLSGVADTYGKSLSQMRSAIGVRLSPNQDFIIVSASSDDADEAAAMANDVVAAYRATRKAQNDSEAKRATQELDTQIRVKREEIDAVGRQLVREPENEGARAQLTVASEVLSSIEQRKGAIEVQAATYDDGVNNVTKALKPTPSRSRPILINAVGGGVLGLLVAAILAWLRTTRRPRTADYHGPATYVGAPLVGRIPRLAGEELRQINAPQQMPGAQFQRVASALQLKVPRGVVLVSGLTADVGCSTTAANLAIALARDGRRVTVVDADATDVAVTRLLMPEARQKAGLTQRLNGADLSNDEYRVPLDDVHDVYVIPPGPSSPNFENALRSERADHLFTELRGAYDYVVVDCPPMLDTSVLASLARQADGILVVVRHETSIERLEEARQLLEIMPASAQRVGYVYTFET